MKKTSGIKAKHAGWNPPGKFKALVVRMRRKVIDAAAELLPLVQVTDLN